ncbi:MAG: hypothetical protein DI535_06060 [Citrobacter freundii]|nr:MAG: hypothetical protein DI535_06060 [Citrobacter freundii]
MPGLVISFIPEVRFSKGLDRIQRIWKFLFKDLDAMFSIGSGHWIQRIRTSVLKDLDFCFQRIWISVFILDTGGMLACSCSSLTIQSNANIKPKKIVRIMIDL